MANNDGILINVGFKSDDIDGFIEEIQDKLKNANLGENLKLDGSLKEELEAVNTVLDKINNQKANIDTKSAQQSVQQISKEAILAEERLKRINNAVANVKIKVNTEGLENKNFSTELDDLIDQINNTLESTSNKIDSSSLSKRLSNLTADSFKSTGTQIRNYIQNLTDAIEILRTEGQTYSLTGSDYNLIDISGVALDSDDMIENADRLANFYRDEIQRVKNIIQQELNNFNNQPSGGSSGSGNIPLNLEFQYNEEVLKAKLDIVYESLEAYAQKKPVQFKVDLISDYSSTAVSKAMKKVLNELPNLDKAGVKETVEKQFDIIGENITKGFEFKLNTEKLKPDLEHVKEILKELRSEIHETNKELVITPTTDPEKLKAELAKFDKITEEYANEQAKKTTKRSKLGGRSEEEIFINNLDLIINKLKKLTESEQGLDNLVKAFENLRQFTTDLSGKDLSDSQLVKNLGAIQDKLKITPANGLANQIDTIINKSNQLAEAYKTLDSESVTKNIANYSGSVETLKTFTTQYNNFVIALSKKPDKKVLDETISTVNAKLNNINTSKIDKIESLDNISKSFNGENLKQGLDAQKETIANFINDVKSYKEDYAQQIAEMSEQTDNVKLQLDFDKVQKDLANVATSIGQINIPASDNGVLNVLSGLLANEGAIDKLITLFNTPFASVAANMKMPVMDDKAIAKAGIERFYSAIDTGKQKLKTALSNGDLTSVNDYYKAVQNIAEAYDDLKKTDRSIVSQEEFERARTQLESFVKDTNTIINSMFENLHPSIKEKFADEIEQVQVYLKATQIKPKTLSGAKDIEGNKATLLEILQLLERINNEGFLEKSIAEAENRLDSLSGKLVKVTNAFEKVSKTPTIANSDNLYTELTQLLELKEKIAKDNELELISDSQMNDANRRIESVISSLKETYKATLTRQFADVPLEGFVNQTDAIDASIDKAMEALNKFDVTTFNAEIKSASEGISNLTNTVKASSQYAKDIDQFNNVLNKLPELQQKAFKGNAADVNLFINALKTAQQQYESLQQQASNNESLQSSFNEANKDVSRVINTLKFGYDTVIQEQKKLYSNTEQLAKNANISSMVKSSISGGLSGLDIKTVQGAMDAGRNNFAAMISDQNVLANGLAYDKVLGKIYNTLIRNSGASKELKNNLRTLAKEMENAGASGTSKTMLDSYSKRFQAIDTEIKRAGQTGISFFDRLGKSMTTQSAQLIAMTFSFYRLISVFRQGIQTATEFDTALAKISYTMDISQSELDGMGKSMMNLASELKTSLSGIEQIYTIYANMNTSDKEVENLSRYTAILSNLSGIDASTAADDIQAVVNQFENLNSTDTSHIVDVFDYISRNIAVDYSKGIEGMAEGVQAVGNVADKAGLSYEQLSAIIAKTMEQTRNSGSSIANGLKTIMVRLSKASSMDDEVDNSTLSKASAALHEIGVEVYTAEGEFRQFDTIMTELAGKWDKLTEAQQANISFQIAATRQTAVLKAILQNWTSSMDLATNAVETNGNALENQEKYADTYAAKIQEMKTSFQEMWVNIFNTDGFDTLLNILEGVASAFSKIASTLGLIPTALAAISFIPLLKNIKQVGSAFTKLMDTGALVTSKSAQLGGLAIQGKSAQELAIALDGLSARQAALAVSTSSLSAAEKEQVLAMYAATQASIAESNATLGTIFQTHGLTTEQVKAINTELALAEASGTLTAAKYQEILALKQVDLALEEQEAIYAETMALNGAQTAQVGLLGRLKTGWANLAASLGLTSLQLGLVAGGLIAVFGGIALYNKLTYTQKEYTDDLNESLDELSQEQSKLDSLNSELKETSDRMAELQSKAENGTITIVEQEELQKLKETNAELEKNIALQKSKTDKEAVEAFEQARENPTKGYSGFKYTDATYSANIYEEIGDTQHEYNYKSITDAIKGTIETYEKEKDKLQELNKQFAEGTLEAWGYNDEILENAQGNVDSIASSLSDNFELLEKKKEGYEGYLEAGKTFTKKQQEEYDEIIATEKAYYKKMYEITGDEAYFNAMDRNDRFEVWKENVKKSFGEAYSLVDQYVKLEEQFDDLRSKGVTYDELRNTSGFGKGLNAQNFKMDDGRAFAFDTSNVSASEKEGLENHVKTLYEQAKHEFENQGISYTGDDILKRMLEIDNTGLQTIESFAEKAIKAMHDAFDNIPEEEKLSFEDAWAKMDNDEATKKMKENLTQLADEGMLTPELFTDTSGIDKWARKFGTTTNEATEQIKTFKSWADKLGISFDEVIRKINSLSTDETRLKSLKGSVSKLQNAYSEKRDAVITNKDSTKQKGKLNKIEAASASTIADLQEDFGELKAWDKYKKAIGSTTSTLEECKKAQNALLTEFYNSGKFINDIVDATGEVDEATRQYYISQMEELGIANAEEVVNKEILQRKTELLIETKDLNNVTEDSIGTIIQEANALNTLGVDAQWAAKMVNILLMQKKMAGHQKLAVEGDLQYLKDLKTMAEQTGIALDDLTAATYYYTQAEALRKVGGGSAGEASKLFKKAEDAEKRARKKIRKAAKSNRLKGNQVDMEESPYDSTLDKTTNSSKKKTKEYIDWIERYIEEQQHKINAAEARLANVFGEKSQNKIYNKIIKYYGNIAKAYKVASKKYKSSFNAFLDSKDGKKYINKDIENRIKNGTISGDPKKLIQTFGEERGKVIKEAIDRWKKYEDAEVNAEKSLTDKRNARIEKIQKQADRRQASMELNKQYAEAEERGYNAQNDYLDKSQKKNEQRIKKLIKIAKIEHDITEQKKLQEELEQSRIENEKAKFDNLIADYERQRAANERNIQRTQNSMDLQAARGMNISEKYYRSQNSQYNAELKNINNELAKAREKVKSIKQGTDERNEAEQNILDLETEYNTKLQSIYNNNKAIVELYNNYLDTRANVNDRMLNELSFLDSLADYAKHTSKEVQGFFTDAGYAALDVARKGMEISKTNMEMYTDNLARLQKARKNADGTFTYLTKDGDSVTFNSELDYVKALQNAYDKVQNYAKSYYDNTVKAVDLMKEKYQTELELVKELVDAKKKELDAEKDLHDYQRTISEKTTNITNLERQLAAYSGNTSEEGRAKLQSLQKQLSDAQKDLEETEYDRYISDQKNMLDDLYQKYNDEVTKRLDQFNKLLEEALGENGAITKGNAFLDQITKGIGYDSEYNVLKSLKDLKTEITALGQKAYKDSGMDDGKGGSSKTNNTSTKEDFSPRQSFVMEKPQKQKNNNKTADQDAKIKGTRDSLKKKIKNIVNNSKYQKKDTKNLSEVNKLIYKEYKKALTTTGLKEVAKILGVPYDKDKNSKLWKSIKDLYGFSKGGIASIIKKNGDDGIATLKRGEAVLTPQQTKQFATLARNLDYLNNAAKLNANVPKQEVNNNVTYGDMTFNFELPNVTDSQTFLNEIKNNQKIQKALQEVTVNQLITPTKLGVKKIK